MNFLYFHFLKIIILELGVDEIRGITVTAMLRFLILKLVQVISAII